MKLTPLSPTHPTNSLIIIVLLLFMLAAYLHSQSAVKASDWGVPDNLAFGAGMPKLLTSLTNIKQVATGWGHTCALMQDDTVFCWGNNAFGQVGDGTSENNYLVPTKVVGLGSPVQAITAGQDHSCALTKAGAVYCWGSNRVGQLGNNESGNRQTKPVAVADLASGVQAITAGWTHTCALRLSGTVFCWGGNEYGQVGDGTNGIDRRMPVAVSGLPSGIESISAGSHHSCALTTTKTIFCWGLNEYGQLGDGTTTNRATPIETTGLAGKAEAITTGWGHSCALTVGGSVQCWGRNYYGQVGDGTSLNNKLTPVLVDGLSDGIQAVAAGGRHSCALKTSGAVLCWGLNLFGQVGNNSLGTIETPQMVTGLTSGVQKIAIGDSHGCAIMSTTLLCWGHNAFGQLGDGRIGTKIIPMAVPGLERGAQKLSAGGSHSCALNQSNTLLCWGQNAFGQVGDNTSGNNRSSPITVTGSISNIQTIVAGDSHSCMLTTNNSVFCWGRNEDGQLGDGTTTDKHTPTIVASLTGNTKAVSAGSRHTCALTLAGTVFCWGSNAVGQLGNGTMVNNATPTAVVALANGVKAIATGVDHSCALTQADAVFCWGGNASGQLGDGTVVTKSTPVSVTGLESGIQAITAGLGHSCALTKTGAIRCWGRNPFGQIGDGTKNDRLTPVAVEGLGSNVRAIVTGWSHSCALTDNKTVFCWGHNVFGQLGDNTMENKSTPVAVIDLTSNIEAITAAGRHTCALSETGAVLCWGSNAYGQLGDDSAWRATPDSIVAPNPIYLAIVSNAPTPTATPTATPLRVWQRVGQRGLEVAALALQGDELFVADRRGFDKGGGLYIRALNGCTNRPDFGRNGDVKASVLAVALPATPNTAGVVAAYLDERGIFFRGSGGQPWQQTTSPIVYPQSLALASAPLVYAGTASNSLYISDDGGASWRQQTSQPPAINTLQMQGDILWIGSEATGVWNLSPGSDQPQAKNQGLPDNSNSKKVYDFAFQSASEIYLATYNGVYNGDGVNDWQEFGLQGKTVRSLTIKDGSLYAGVIDEDNKGNVAGVWQRSLTSDDWQALVSPGWDQTYTVRDLLYVDGCQGLLAATDDGVWIYK